MERVDGLFDLVRRLQNVGQRVIVVIIAVMLLCLRVDDRWMSMFSVVWNLVVVMFLYFLGNRRGDLASPH